MNNNLAQQLRDIRGIDSISWWPPAIGWWGVMCLAIMILSVCIALYVRRTRYKKSWQCSATSELEKLRKKLKNETSKKLVSELSELIKRIAVKKFNRGDCAGLSGRAWLKWLRENDPRLFNWEQHGKILIDIPYAPPGVEVNPKKLTVLINAAMRWVS